MSMERNVNFNISSEFKNSLPINMFSIISHSCTIALLAIPSAAAFFVCKVVRGNSSSGLGGPPFPV
ncbi:uncharacterized protein BDZ99DRAFT_460092 [Mytilinidion resinicola]|uniref:Uncharacterized protein n=1 Tax=Mytilinidion resinicola TaxID=574789 RepID=A0A6A6Z2C4_9PEZI|nr:uncharacterized protein BDZ99DRAFT_460092 [Mytilinidion resinicola]KAF2814444.1 hypothetical protein BDZ99DRAFT_460092 [Mytilinidion resinicola]